MSLPFGLAPASSLSDSSELEAALFSSSDSWPSDVWPRWKDFKLIGNKISVVYIYLKRITMQCKIQIKNLAIQKYKSSDGVDNYR